MIPVVDRPHRANLVRAAEGLLGEDLGLGEDDLGAPELAGDGVRSDAL